MEEQRKVYRDQYSSLGELVHGRLDTGIEKYRCQVINFHYEGACLLLDEKSQLLYRNLIGRKLHLELKLSNKLINESLPCQIVWTDKNLIGVKILSSEEGFSERNQRFKTHRETKPVVKMTDPLNPQRDLIFSVSDMSETGLCLNSSLSNKHLLPGMQLLGGYLSLPTHGHRIAISLSVKNTRKSSTEGRFELGCEILGENSEYKIQSSKYLSYLTSGSLTEVDIAKGKQEELGHISSLGRNSKIKAALTFKLVSTDALYDKVLKLRYKSFFSKQKTTSEQSWRDFGKGLDEEGLILAGFLGGELACSAEVRIRHSKKSISCEKFLKDRTDILSPEENALEINKVVVHPQMQSSDLVLGLFQRLHAYVAINKHPKVILSATPKLSRMYLRIGAKKTNISYHHPYLHGEKLDIYTIEPATFKSGSSMNPAAWQLIYGATENYLEQINSNHHKSSPAKSFASSFFKNKFSNILKKVFRTKNPSLSSSVKSSRWSKQHMLCPVVWPYILEAESLIGEKNVAEILSHMNISKSYLSGKSNWVSLDFLNTFLDCYSKHGSLEILSKKAGERSMRKDVLGLNYYVIKHLATPDLLISSLKSAAAKFNLSRTYDVKKLGPWHIAFHIGASSTKLLPKHRESCDNWQASLDSSFRLLKTPAKIEKKSCMYDGASQCSYEIKWSRSQSLTKRLAYPTLLSIAGLGIYTWAGQKTVLACTTFLALYSIYKKRKELLEAGRNFEDYQTESKERYRELEKSREELDRKFKEAHLLELTIESIQNSSATKDTLQTCLDTACSHFKFDRAFIMLRNEDKSLLQTEAVDKKTSSAKLWKFKVDITKRKENSALLSSIYHSGATVFIDSLEDHLFQLEQRSIDLIKELDTRGFIMSAIPSSDGSVWGVLVADTRSKDVSLTHEDAILLKRISSHLGLALDKQAKLEEETSLRQTFEKFVPSSIVESSKNLGSPSLGGQMREVAAMFVDIRGFTKISSEFSAEKTLDLLNRFYGLLNKVVTSHGGIVDKYLGDGALIIWGYHDNFESTNIVVKAALELISKLEVLNESLEIESLERLNIGIGINQGKAICGNVGCDERLEYTCVGTDINKAARLEALCKDYNSKLIISETIYSNLDSEIKESFELKSQISIRGLKENHTIALFKGEADETKSGEHSEAHSRFAA